MAGGNRASAIAIYRSIADDSGLAQPFRDLASLRLAARPGRIDQAVELPLPDPAGLERLLERYAAGLTARSQRRPEPSSA